jgi:hypothetical protein
MPFEGLGISNPFGGATVSGRLPTKEECREVWQLNRAYLIAAVVDAEQWAFSYSGKRYAAACLAFRYGATLEAQFRIFSGWNCTPFRRPKGEPYNTTWPKPCAERMATEMAREAGYTPFGYAILSDNDQPDDMSNVWSRWQHPCHECRCMLDQQHLPDFAPLMLIRRWPCAPSGLLILQTTFGASCRTHGHQLGQRLY